MSDEQPEGLDYAALAEGIDQYREVLRAMVAGLMDDGFTDEQARALTVRMFTSPQ